MEGHLGSTPVPIRVKIWYRQLSGTTLSQLVVNSELQVLLEVKQLEEEEVRSTSVSRSVNV